MEREREYNTDLTKIHHTNYVRNSRAVVVLWAVFTCIFLILDIVVFIQPSWIGDSGDSAVAGLFGLYQYCEEVNGVDFTCSGDFVAWDSILNSYFKACSVMVGFSCLFFIACIACFLLFCLLNAATVLKICGWFQVLSGFLILTTLIVYPGGWDHPKVRAVCGLGSGKYDIGVCEMRWGYALAIVLVFDAFILAILAFILSVKQANLLPEVYKKEKEKDKRSFIVDPPRDSEVRSYTPYYDTHSVSTKNGKKNGAYVVD